MPKIRIVILFFLSSKILLSQTNFGKIQSVGFKSYNSIPAKYSSFDCDSNNAFEVKAVVIKKGDNHFYIKNKFNDGYEGHTIKFMIDCNLNVCKASYDEWTDLIDGSETTFTIKKISLKLNHNPFDVNENEIWGYYTIDLMVNYFPPPYEDKKKALSKNYEQQFYGKFRFCN